MTAGLVSWALVALAVSGVAGQDEIVMCGGFVKAPALMTKLGAKTAPDFSAVRVQLTTLDGLFKAEAECAPNGYYLLPLYDGGEFLLRPVSARGWAFDPPVAPAGAGGACGGDVNFVIAGFAVGGSVVDGGGVGVRGASVTLRRTPSEGDAVVVEDLSVSTAADGSYGFGGVLPGTYTASVAYAGGLVDPSAASARVTVGWGPAAVPGVLRVAGFDMRGAVLAGAAGDGGVAGVTVYVYAAAGAAVPACEAAAAAPSRGAAWARACVTVTAADGGFSVPGLPSGEYLAVAVYAGKGGAVYDIAPAEARVQVKGAPTEMAAPFRVVGFTVHGHVRGAGVAGAVVSVDGVAKATADAEGRYTLTLAAAGRYTLSAAAPHVNFGGALEGVSVGPSSGALPDILATAYDVCGTVSVADPAGGGAAQGLSPGRAVHLHAAGGAHRPPLATAAAGREDGRFCIAAAPGEYTLHAEVSDAEAAAGLSLSPAVRPVTVRGGPVLDADFSPASLTLAGSVTCLGDRGCPRDGGVTVALLTKAGGRTARSPVPVAEDGSFEITGVWPGAYLLTASHARGSWCFGTPHGSPPGEERVPVAAVPGRAERATIAHTGALLTLTAEADMDVEVVPRKKGSERPAARVLVRGGRASVCLAPGNYSVTPDACFEVEGAPLRVTVGALAATAPAAAVLRVRRVRVRGSVRVVDTDTPGAAPGAASAVISVAVSGAGADTTANVTAGPGAGVFEYTVFAAPGAHLRLTPSASGGAVLFFYPPALEAIVPAAGCGEPLPALVARPGVFLAGTVTKALGGVTVTVRVDEEGTRTATAAAGADVPLPSGVVASVLSDADGKWSAGPLHQGVQYTASAAKDGYHFRAQGARGLDFVHMRLADVTVRVADAAGAGVAGVLLSLSGGADYRSNGATDASGSLRVNGLFPGAYFVRPMLKEYTFSPASLALDLGEGAAHTATIAARRVAFSVFGRVAGLDGRGEAGTTVVATAAGMAPEQATTDATGSFRIRGLAPGSTYTVALRDVGGGAGGAAGVIERTSPREARATVGDADVRGVDFVVFRRRAVYEVTATVDVDTAHAAAVTVQLARAVRPDVALKSVKLPFARRVEFRGLEAGEYVVRAVASLSTASFRAPPVSSSVTVGDSVPRAHAALTFAVTPRVDLDDAPMGSFYLLMAAIVGGYIFVDRARAVPVIVALWARVHGARAESEESADAAGSTRQRRT